MKFNSEKEILPSVSSNNTMQLLSDIRDYFTISDPIQSESEKDFIKRIDLINSKFNIEGRNMAKKFKDMTKRKRRLEKQRIKSGEKITSHKSKSGRTGHVKCKQKPSKKKEEFKAEIKQGDSSASQYNVTNRKG